jgi:hypothetical protein
VTLFDMTNEVCIDYVGSAGVAGSAASGNSGGVGGTPSISALAL